MDKNLINLIIVVAIALIGFVAIVTEVYWSDLMAAHRWSQIKKAHRMPKQIKKLK